MRPQLALPFGDVSAEAADFSAFIPAEDFSKLPPRYQKAIEQAISLFRFYEKKQDITFSPVLAPLLGVLDDASKAANIHLLSPDLPVDRRSQRDFFDPDLNHLRKDDAREHKRNADNLRRTLVDRGGLMPIGLLLSCLKYAQLAQSTVGGVFQSVESRFADAAKTDLSELVKGIYDFRNTYIAHQSLELTDCEVARQALGDWVKGVSKIWHLGQR